MFFHSEKNFYPPQIKNLVWLFVLLAALCVFSGGCGGGHSGAIGGGNGNDEPIIEELNNKTFETPAGTTGTSTAKDANGTTVNVTASDFSVSFSNVATAGEEVQTSATTSTVTVAYVLTINGTSQSYSNTQSNVALSETSSGVYEFSLGDAIFTIDPTSGAVTLGGKFTFNNTVYTFDSPIKFSVDEKEISTPTPTPTPTPVTNVNELWNGGWLYTSGTVQAFMNNTTVDLTPLQFAVYLENSNVSTDTGSAKLSAVLCLSEDLNIPGTDAILNIRLPILIDGESVTTTRTGDYTWDAKMNSGDFSLTFAEDGKTAGFTGKTRTGYINDVSFDIKMTKVDESNYNNNSNAGLNDVTLTVVSTDYCGGYFTVFGADNGLSVNSFMHHGYANAIFSNVDLDNESAHLIATVAMPANIAYFSGSGAAPQNTAEILLPLVISEDIEIKKMFGGVYRFEILNDIQPTKGIIIFEPRDTTKSYIVLESTYATMKSAFFFNLKKQPDEDNIINLAANLKGTTWTPKEILGQLEAGGILFSQDMQPQEMISMGVSKDDPFELYIESIDLGSSAGGDDVDHDSVDHNTTHSNGQGRILVSLDGTFEFSPALNGQISSIDVETALASLVGNNEGQALTFEHVGYNTLYSQTPHGTLALVLQEDENSGYSAYVFIEVAPTGDKKQQTASAAANMARKNEQ